MSSTRKVSQVLGSKEKERKKKKKDTAKGKNKSTNGSKKRGHSSTPSYSDDTEKLQSEPHPTAEKSGDQAKAKAKGHSKERTGRKSQKPKNTESAQEKVVAAPAQSDNAELSEQARESLRWEGALEDPVAEVERLENYRANRRKRYLASRQALVGNTTTISGHELDNPKEDRLHTAGALADKARICII